MCLITQEFGSRKEQRFLIEKLNRIIYLQQLESDLSIEFFLCLRIKFYRPSLPQELINHEGKSVAWLVSYLK